MAKKIDLTIIIVNYNTSKLVLDCITSIKKYLDAVSYEIIIVNNSDRQEEKNILHVKLEAEDEIKIIDSENRGFGAANNLGIKSALGKYLLLLNSDTLMVDNSINKLPGFLEEHREVAGVTPLVYQKDGKTLQRHFYGKFQNLGLVIFKIFRGRRPNLKNDFFYSETITFAAMMIKKTLLVQAGGFDEKFFMYWEDDDLCLRLAKMGFKSAVYTRAKIIHLESQSSPSKKRLEMYYKSQSYYWQKHFGLTQRILMEIVRWPYKTLKVLVFSK